MNKLKILDLFSGIGGFSVGLERTGYYETVAFCEIDKYCKLLLQKHWKGVKIYDDVKKITKEGFQADGIEFPDVITGGFPCQPFSVAGKQKGTSDDRHLWPEMFRIIQAFKPRFVIGENVRVIINIQDGVVFETVCTDLESEGYEVQPFIIPAAGVGAPHRRERVWIIAIREESMVNSEHNGSPTSTIEGSSAASSDDNEKGQIKTSEFEGTSGSRNDEDVANTEGERLQRSRREESSGDFHGLEQDPKRIESEIRSESERRSGIPADVADTDSGLRRGGRTIESSGEDNEGRIHSKEEEQTREYLRSETIRRSSIRGETKDVADTECERTKRSEEDRSLFKNRGDEILTDRLQTSKTTYVGGNSDSGRETKDVADTNTRLGNGENQEIQTGRNTSNTSSEDVADNDGERQQKQWRTEPIQEEVSRQTKGIGSERQSWWSIEPDVGRVAHGVQGRVHRLKGLGNAIVPQIAETIGRALINAADKK